MRNRQVLDQGQPVAGHVGGKAMPHLVEQGDLVGRQPQGGFQDLRQAGLAPRSVQARPQRRWREVRQQVHMQRRAIAHRGRDGVDAAAFDPLARDDPFPARGHSPRDQADSLHRLAEDRHHVGRPVDGESAIRGPERCHVSHVIRPFSVRSQPRPACAAAGQDRDVGGQDRAAVGRVEPQVAPRPPLPGPAGAKGDAPCGQPCQPGAQQRRRLHRHRKQPAGRSGEDGLAQILGPGGNMLRTE